MTTNEFTSIVSSDALESLFTKAHTQRSFEPEDVDRSAVDSVYDVIKWAPTAFNSSALRISVVESDDARAKLAAHMSPGNTPHVEAAPLVLVLSYDAEFTKGMAQMGTPADLVDSLSGNMDLAYQSALMQAAYLIVGLRAAGFHVGPMTGGNFDGIREDLLSDTNLHPFMVVVAGRKPTTAGFRPRKGRLPAEDAVNVL